MGTGRCSSADVVEPAFRRWRYRECVSRGVVAGGSGRGDITFSAGAAIGPVLIGVNSTNRFPSVAAWARDRISEFVDRELRSVIDAATDLRVETKTRQASAEAGVTPLDWKSVLDAGKLVHDRGVSPSEVKEQMRSWLLS